MAANYHFVNSTEINNKTLNVTSIQRVTSGIFRFGLSSSNRGRAAIPGTVFLAIDANGNITGDIRVHDGIKKGGISTPPPGTVSHMIPRKDASDPKGFSTRDGWLFCDGAILDKDEYGALYSAIGDYWNEDPSLTSSQFQIPDLRGYFIRCYKAGQPFGVASRQEDAIKKHSHYNILTQSGNHTHNYTEWKINPASSFVDPTADAPLGVLNNPAVPGHRTRAAYVVADPPADMTSQVLGDNSVFFDLIHTSIPSAQHATSPEYGWDEASYNDSTSPDITNHDPNSYISLGEGFTRPMGTYDTSNNWQPNIEQHLHHMITEDAQSMPSGANPDIEGTIVNIKIPTFIKY